MEHQCVDCKIKIDKRSTRCHSCAIKEGHRIGVFNSKGKNNPNYKDGKTLKKYYCINCKKELSISAYRGIKRCRKCYGIWRSKYIRGNKLANWLGGISFIKYPSAFTEKLKESIRKRDNYTCQKCYIHKIEYNLKYNRRLDIHHIDYNKKNCDEKNLITLCNTCNKNVNFNRAYWNKYFTNKIRIKYDK